MKAFHADRQPLVLPPGHRFPATKYGRLRTRVEGWEELDVREAEPVGDEVLALAHDAHYVQAIAGNGLGAAEQRAIGFPWSEAMVDRARRSVGATLAAARAVQADAARAAEAGPPLPRIVVIDLDVHQGDGTAAIFAADDTVFTLSLHGEKNFPFRNAASDLAGLLERDVRVLRGLRGRRIPVALTMAGGYGRDIEVTVAIQAATIRAGIDSWQGWKNAGP